MTQSDLTPIMRSIEFAHDAIAILRGQVTTITDDLNESRRLFAEAFASDRSVRRQLDKVTVERDALRESVVEMLAIMEDDRYGSSFALTVPGAAMARARILISDHSGGGGR